jgi:hypothetical protein
MNNQEKKWSVSEVIEHLSRAEEAVEFLHENGIANVVTVESIERYEAGDDRKGLIVKVQEAGNDNLSSVMIDIKHGQPSTEQVYDAVYGIGKDCFKRVIMFTSESDAQDGWNPTADKIAVRNLIDVMNSYPLKLYLEKFNDGGFYPEPIEKDAVEGGKPEFLIEDLPSPERFRAEEFWAVYFDWHNQCCYEPWNAFEGGIRESSDWGHMLFTEPEVAEIPVYWTNDGIKFVVKQTEEEGDYLRKVWTLKQDELMERYKGGVEFEFLPGKLPKIHIQYSDRPVSWLMSATSEEKFEFAKQLHSDFWGLFGYWSEAMEEAENALVA